MSAPVSTYVYKILRLSEWNAATAQGVFAGSPDDGRDGFLHFSEAHQVRGTVEKHFHGEDQIVLAMVDAAALGDALKWEVSRGGEAFPHLYAPLALNAVKHAVTLTRDDCGTFVYPAEVP